MKVYSPAVPHNQQKLLISLFFIFQEIVLQDCSSHSVLCLFLLDIVHDECFGPLEVSSALLEGLLSLDLLLNRFTFISQNPSATVGQYRDLFGWQFIRNSISEN